MQYLGSEIMTFKFLNLFIAFITDILFFLNNKSFEVGIVVVWMDGPRRVLLVCLLSLFSEEDSEGMDKGRKDGDAMR